MRMRCGCGGEWGLDWMGLDWMGWDGMGWDAMGWDAMGWDGMVCDGIALRCDAARYVYHSAHKEANPTLHRITPHHTTLSPDPILYTAPPTDTGAKNPTCQSQLGLLLGTARVPKIGRDEVVGHAQSTHAVVACRGSFYKINLLSADGSAPLPPAQLARALEVVEGMAAVQGDSGADGAPSSSSASTSGGVGAFTACDRDFWAEQRAALEAAVCF